MKNDSSKDPEKHIPLMERLTLESEIIKKFESKNELGIAQLQKINTI